MLWFATVCPYGTTDQTGGILEGCNILSTASPGISSPRLASLRMLRSLELRCIEAARGSSSADFGSPALHRDGSSRGGI